MVRDKLSTVKMIRNFVEGGVPPDIPINIFMEVSNLCDLECVMCGPFSRLSPSRLNSMREDSRGFIDVDVFDKVEKFLNGALNLQIFGYGETTLHPHFLEILSKCKTYDIPVSFFSNGMHLDDRISEAIVDSNVFEVNISFSGATKLDYEAIYHGGHFETVLSGLKRISDLKKSRNKKFPIISINSLAYKHHINRLSEFVSLMASVGVDVIDVKPVIPVPSIPQLASLVCIPHVDIEGSSIQRAKDEASRLGIDLRTGMIESLMVKNQDEYLEMQAAIFAAFGAAVTDKQYTLSELTTLKVEPYPVDKTIQIFRRDNLRPFEGEFALQKASEEKIYCMEPFQTFYVGRNREVKPCCNSSFPTGFGSLINMDVESIWKGIPYQTIRGTIQKGFYPELCRDCVTNGNAHKHHHYLDFIYNYCRWYQGCYDIDLYTAWRPEIEAIKSAGDNASIIRRYTNTQTKNNLA